MFDHVTIRAEDLDASQAFYRTVLGTLGIDHTHTNPRLPEWDDFSIAGASQDRGPTRNLHIAFVASGSELVDAFWEAGRRAGHPDAGAPGPRPQYRSDYYGAFLRDPDGNSVEAVCHGDTRRGGHIDHLWVRVRDVAASARFYTQIARHCGLRIPAQRDDRQQVLGAWATVMLLADSTPATEGLHIAFPAPDRETVDAFHAAATTAGYPSNGEPGERPKYHPGYYGAFVFDPDGTNVESVHHG